MRAVRIDAPAAHRFPIGNFVTFEAKLLARKGAYFGKGPYEVLAHLPEDRGVLQYRIKSSFEPCQRVAKETDLVPSAGV